MHRSACYFPVVPNRQGEIEAVGHLSPRARARTRIVFEIDRPPDADATNLEEHVADAARRISEAWGSSRPLLVDLPDYGPEHRLRNGASVLEHAFTCLRQHGMLAVPVVGPISARGDDVLETIRYVAKRDARGAALRVPFQELSHPDVFRHEIIKALHVLALAPPELDLILDLEVVHYLPAELHSAAHLAAVTLEALAVASEFGEFRNTVLCGSSVPESVGKDYEDVPYRTRRLEFDAWMVLLLESVVPLSFSDHGITPPRGPDPRGHGPAPARIRLSTPTDHVFHRARYQDYIDLCKRVVTSADFDAEVQAWGASILQGCARGYIQASSPVMWVARDTNLHMESTLAEVERRLRAIGRIGDFRFPPEERFAWLQQSILEDSRT